TPPPAPTSAAPPLPFLLAACKPEKASFYDNFHKPDAGWNFVSGPLSHLADGQLAVAPNPNQSFSAEYLSLRFENVTICAHIKSPPALTAPDGDTRGGIVFWADSPRNYYTAVIRPDGNYYLYRRFAGSWLNMIPGTKSAQINTGMGAVNELAVELVDSSGALFINNVRVREFRGQPPKVGGAVGLHVESEKLVANEWRFLDIAAIDNGKS